MCECGGRLKSKLGLGVFLKFEKSKQHCVNCQVCLKLQLINGSFEKIEESGPSTGLKDAVSL